MKDRYGREISYLRVSVTDRCNLRCVYCMPAAGVPQKGRAEVMTNEEFVTAAKAAVCLGVRKIRITGGEPLLRRGVEDVCASIGAISGVEELCMTTNGILLPDCGKLLLRAGVSRLNISLNTLREDRYRQITRQGELDGALRGIETALRLGFEKLKINVVLMKDFNGDEIGNFLRFARENDVEVRFIELMPLGEARQYYAKQFLSAEHVLKRCPELIPLPSTEGVARRYAIPGGRGAVGLIRPMSSHFCGECCRMRLTADGRLRPCLHSGEEISVKGLAAPQMKERLRKAISEKPAGMERGSIQNAGREVWTWADVSQSEGDFCGAIRNMNEIGG